MLFSELPILESTKDALIKMGFSEPTEIQSKSIPVLCEGDMDFIGQAQTGTGKTVAYSIPLIEKINPKLKATQALIIAPTRELALQIKDEMDKLSEFSKVESQAIFGGVSLGHQLKVLKKRRPQVIVGTPGRLCDLLNRGELDLSKSRFVVLDEADEMLNMGFFEDVKYILDTIKDKKTWMFSATMPKEILKLAKEFFTDPMIVKVTKKILTNEKVDQQYCLVKRQNRTEALARFLDLTQDIYAIVFTRTKVGAKELTDELNSRGFSADALHGDMSQEQRNITMKRFKQKKINLLICTDVAARGIDVTDLTHVINYSLPQDNESYVHRIGRTGRAGNKGVALSIIDPLEESRLRQIEKITCAKIDKIQTPSIAELQQVLLTKELDKFTKENIEIEESVLYETFVNHFEGLSKEELINSFYKSIYDQNLKKYESALSIDLKSRAKSSTPVGRVQYNRYHFNHGKNSGMQTGDLINFVAKKLDISGSHIGKITIMPNFSFFELPDSLGDEVMKLNKHSYNGQKVFIEKAKPREESKSRGGRRRSPRRRFNRA